MIEIHVEERTTYGAKRFYPANQAARALALLLGSKTLTAENLRHALAIDPAFSVRVTAPELAEFAR